MTNYFELLGLPKSFDIDTQKLNANYFERQRQHHPDKAGTSTTSAQLNEAYNTLKDRTRRAAYMAGQLPAPSPALLMEIMELREDGNITEARTQIEQLFTQFAKAGEAEQKSIFTKIKYLSKFIEDFEAQE